MIVVVGSPVFHRGGLDPSARVAGQAGRIACIAAAAGRSVQLVGRVGDDDAGDALLIALAASGVGHAAVLRDASHATPETAGPADTVPDDGLFADDATAGRAPAGLPLEPADVELALRYLTDFRVVVIADSLDAATTTAVLDAAAFAGAHAIGVTRSGDASPEDRPDVELSLFGAPEHDEPAIAELVGRYAAGMDVGRSPADAFADATRSSSWERSAAD